MKVLNREEILKARPRQIEEVNCPELEGTIRLQELYGDEMEDYQASNRGKPDKDGNVSIIWKGSAARLLAKCIVDEEGKRIFADGDAPALGKLNAKALNRLFLVACKLNGIGEQEQEEILKNSEPGQDAGD